jgi:2-keto-4-pentenoate hydratase/2-oxohepta-3-ene-1,7-dioic acid hydratase in catechol pathway
VGVIARSVSYEAISFADLHLQPFVAKLTLTMKIVRFAMNGKTRYGILSEESIQVLSGRPFRSLKPSDLCYRLNEVRLLTPCQPSKIVCLGLNYRSHAEETGMPVPETPLLFLKPPTTLIGPEEDILYPAMSERVDYEGELGVVVGKRARQVSSEAALDYVLGYTCFNDVTARDLQQRDGQWTRAKGFDTFAAIGPCI